MEIDRNWLRKRIEEDPDIPVEAGWDYPVAISFSRRCYAAEHGGCACPGLCKKPISHAEQIAAAKAFLGELEADG